MKKWRRNNIQTALMRKTLTAEIEYWQRLGGSLDSEYVKKLEKKRAGYQMITKKEARTFYAPEVATPSPLILRLVYGPNYVNILQMLAEAREAEKQNKARGVDVSTHSDELITLAP